MQNSVAQKYLSNQVNIILFTDEKIFRPKNPQNDCIFIIQEERHPDKTPMHAIKN